MSLYDNLFNQKPVLHSHLFSFFPLHFSCCAFVWRMFFCMGKERAFMWPRLRLKGDVENQPQPSSSLFSESWSLDGIRSSQLWPTLLGSLVWGSLPSKEIHCAHRSFTWFSRIQTPIWILAEPSAQSPLVVFMTAAWE